MAVCQFVEVSCPFAEAGCAFRAVRKDMGAYSSDTTAHLLLLMTTVATVKAESAAVKAKTTVVEAETTVVEAENASVRAENMSMKSDLNSLQRYLSIIHTPEEEASGREWLTRTLSCNTGDTFIYTGQMRGGRCDGFGRASFSAADHVDKNFDGQWKNGSRHGYGFAEDRNGDSDEGRWVTSKRQGRFIHTKADGTRYESMYKDNVQTSEKPIV
jgi:hypothetical protein